MPEALARLGPIAVADAEDRPEDDGQDDPDVGHEAAAQADDRLRQLGELIGAAEVLEHRLERRDDPGEHDGDDREGDEEHRGRVHERALHLALELHALLDVDGEPLEDRVEDAAELTGRDEVHEESVKDLRVTSQALGEGPALLHVRLDVLQDRVELLVLALRAEDVEALHQREARVDHRRELTHEDDQVLLGHRAAQVDMEFLGLLLDLEGIELLRAETRGHHVGGIRLHDPLAGLSVRALRFPDPFGHSWSSTRNSGSQSLSDAGRRIQNHGEPHPRVSGGRASAAA